MVLIVGSTGLLGDFSLEEHEWKREVHRYIDEGIDKYKKANQTAFKNIACTLAKHTAEFEAVHDRINKAEANILESNNEVLAASATAHAEIIGQLQKMHERLDKMDGRLGRLENKN